MYRWVKITKNGFKGFYFVDNKNIILGKMSPKNKKQELNTKGLYEIEFHNHGQKYKKLNCQLPYKDAKAFLENKFKNRI